ncbi:hypothetical protein WICMUC_003138 [Wickerhamomyces mucosus]|uniref:Dolichyl-diphosphooligosaccharide--protein glycosyltransferase subunit 3 n=1 Tax=Wickerhamomyces mucosus TaxID=1378264 RepID=A0A9P8PN96_9ASCO|nr:hypothetical protein WICMUC_003138 [Wickerhamomyces mucosus]
MAVAYAIDSAQLLQYKDKTGSNLIKLRNSNYKKILEGPRDSHILVLLTATNPQVGCVVCHEIHPSYTKVADSWFSQFPEGENFFFAKADFIDGQSEVFKAFELNNVPRAFLFSPTDKPSTIGDKQYEMINLPQGGVDFGGFFHQGVRQISGKQFQIIEPIQYGNIIITAIATFLFVLSIKKYTSIFSSILTNRPIWGGISVFFILLFITGYMFNTIRGTPYLRPNKDGGIDYFVQGQQDQLGAETQIMSFIYAVLAFSVVSLITKAKEIKNEKVHLAVVVILSAIILVTFSVLTDIFSLKSQGYPYSLIKFSLF